MRAANDDQIVRGGTQKNRRCESKVSLYMYSGP